MGIPGKKLLFMGGEFGQVARMESRRAARLGPDTNLPRHDGLRRLVQHLNYVYQKRARALGSSTIPTKVSSGSISTMRTTASSRFCANRARAKLSSSSSMPRRMVRYDYRLGVPHAGFYREIINTDAETYGGSNVGNHRRRAERSGRVAWRAIIPFSFNCRRSRQWHSSWSLTMTAGSACGHPERSEGPHEIGYASLLIREVPRDPRDDVVRSCLTIRLRPQDFQAQLYEELLPLLLLSNC